MQYKLYFSLVLFLSIILAFSSCAVKKMTKQAEQFEAAGMFKEASGMYYNALMKKPAKADLKIALKRTSQLYLEELSSNVKNAYNRGDYKETVYQYMEATDLMSKVGRTGISLKPDPAMERYYGDAKNFYLDGRYTLGLRYITDQDYKEAKQVFNEIYKIDPDYKDTRVYLNEATFEPVYREGTQLFSEGRFMDAYSKWESIYASQRDYKDVKDRMDQALSERYKQGTLLLMQEDFNNAALALGDVYRVNPNFQDVKVQYFEARNEPVYRQAKIYLAQDKCRTAYFDFDRIIADAGTYKDTKMLKENALACAEYPIAVYSPPIKQYAADAAQFENTLIKNLLDKNNIFLKVFDLSSVDSRVESQLINRSGNIDDAALKHLRDRNGIKAVLILDYSDFRKNKGSLKKEQQTGFERIITKNKDGESSIYDRRVNYDQFSQQNEVALRAAYKLVSTSSGEIVLSGVYSGTQNDEINYVSYSGDRNSLYPAKSSNGIWSVNENGYKKLQSLLNAETNIKSTEELESRLFNNLTDNIASDINNFNPEK